MKAIDWSVMLVTGMSFSGAPLSGSAQEPAGGEVETAELPLQRVVMFSSGVAYYEHAGNLTGSVDVELKFETEQINDVLKSLVVRDSAGRVSGARYPVRDPLERTLGGFAIDLSEEPSLPDLLRQLRGHRVRVESPQALEGRVVGVETRHQVVGQPETRVERNYLSLATEQGIQTVVVENVDTVRIADDALNAEFQQALATLAEHRESGRRSMRVGFRGEDRRRVQLGYVIEAPVWKTSYRLDFGHGDEQALLQGWAIVENTTDRDWQDVELSLVSGQPISFIQDLYTPLYIERPEVAVPRPGTPAPRLHEEGMSQEQAGESKRAAGDRVAYVEEETGARMMAPTAADLGADDAVQPAAEGEAVGELFRFRFDHPVDLPRRQSAMLALVNERVSADKVSIYNQREHQRHPVAGAEFVNDTGVQLLGGAVTVLDGGMYAGDALIEGLLPGEKRLLSYAVDTGVTVDPSQASSRAITAARIVEGVLELSHLHRYTRTYALKNKDTETRRLIVEHPYNPDRELVEPDTAAEKTPEWYRFHLDLKADGRRDFVVREQRVEQQSIALLERPARTLLGYTESDAIDSKVRAALQRAVDMKRQLDRLEREREQLVRERDGITEGQARLRNNIESVGRDSQLGKRYISKLAEQEDRLDSLDAEIAQLDQRIEQQRRELADFASSLDVG